MPPPTTRRVVLRTAVAGAFVTGAAAHLAARLATDASAAAAPAAHQRDEVYRGRRITLSAAAALHVHPRLLIDGRELHVLRNADGSYTTGMNHYRSFPTLREAARAAVDELGGAHLRPMHRHG